MSPDRVVETDVLVVGGGLAGFLAAIRARELGANVTIAEKGYASKSGGAAFAGGHIAVFNPELGHDFDAWKNFIVTIGEYINNRDWIEVILGDSYARFQSLVSWGIPFLETEHKTESLYFLGSAGVSNCALLVQKKFMPPLREKVLESGAKILDRIMVTDLLKQDGRVVGAVGFDTREGDFYTVKAKATVVSTGASTFKAPGSLMYYATADGESMSYRAGAEITSKEFGGKDIATIKELPSAFKVISGSFRRYVNTEGEEFVKKYTPGFHQLNRLMLFTLFEIHAGRGPIFMDFDTATPEEIRGQAENVRLKGHEWLAKRIGIDLDKPGKIEVMWGGRVGHSSEGFGGVAVNTNCDSTLPGLYAAGDCAGTNFAGSCYTPVGYGLGIAAVTGYRAGQSAAQFALTASQSAIDGEEVARLKELAYRPLARKGGFSPNYVTELLRNLMVPYHVMQVKHGERLQAALTFVKFLEDHHIPMMRANDAHELRMAHEARNMALNAEMVLRASIFRTESRGTHYREDYPHRDDPNWLAWTVLKEELGEMKLFKRPIPKEWWPDLSRPYEERYDMRFPGEVRS